MSGALHRRAGGHAPHGDGRPRCCWRVLAGALAGAAVLGLPEPSLAGDVFAALLRCWARCCCCRSRPAWPARSARAASSSSWRCGAWGRCPGPAAGWWGGMLGAATLALLLAFAARMVGRAGCRCRSRSRASRPTRGVAGTTWRFPLPAGAEGPFDLRVETQPLDPSGARLHV
jgi:hypothetical protein